MKIKRLRYNRRKVFIGLFLFLLLIGVTIGYALITSNLNVEGTARFTNASWNIHFDNYSLMSGSVANLTSPTITDTSITFSARVEKAGDFYGFTVDVENEGNINARVSNFSVTPDFSTIGYAESSITYDNGRAIQVGDILASNKTKTIKVILKYKEDAEEYLYPLTDQDITVTISLDYEQYVDAVPEWSLPSGKTTSTLAVGDEICYSDQCFNFIKYDGTNNENIVMLSKYNLNVGNSANGEEAFIQDSDVIGSKTGVTTYGTVAYSAIGYWGDVVSYPADVYDNTYVTAPDFTGTGYNTTGYSVAYYVEQYKNKLDSPDYGIYVDEARLLTYDEVTDSSIGCVAGSTCSAGFITNTSFWLGSAHSVNSLWGVYANNNLGSVNYANSSLLGVRPVIVIKKTEIQ